MSISEYSNNTIKIKDEITKKDKRKGPFLLLNNTDVNFNYQLFQDTSLHLAIFNFEDIKAIKNFLDNDADIHALNQNCQTPIDIAIDINNEEAVKLLLYKKAHLGRDFQVLICNAIKKSNEAIIKLLIDHGLKNNLLINLRKCLDVAIEEGHLNIINYLIPYCELQKVRDRRFPNGIVFKNGQKYKDCINLLFKHGFVINNSWKKCCNILHSAVENEHTLIVKELLKLRVNVNTVNHKTKLTLLHVAVLNQSLDMVKLLIDYKADVNAVIASKKWSPKDEKLYGKITMLGGKTALHIAVNNADLPITKLLLRNGAKIQDQQLFKNVFPRDKKIIELLLDYFHINHADDGGKTLLHYCAMSELFLSDHSFGCEIAELLLKKGANINSQTNEGFTPVFYAVINKDVEMLKILLDSSADIKHTSVDGNTVLHKAFENPIDAEIIEILLNLNLEVNVTNNNGWTPLHVACQNASEKDVNIIEKLLEYNTNVNCINNNNKKTPLHLACDRSCLPIVQLLIQYNGAVNLIDENGCTSLHLACTRKNLEIIEYLLKNSADPNIKNNDGKTPLIIVGEGLEEWIPGSMECLLELQQKTECHKNLQTLQTIIDKYQKSLKIVELLLQYEANIHVINNIGKSLLHLATEKNYLNIVEVLFKYNIDINIVNDEGQTALHCASEKSHLTIVQKLLFHGADINILSNNNKTALDHALIGIACVRKALKNYLKNPEYCSHEFIPIDYEDDNTKSYRKNIHTYKKIIKILKEHVIKLKCANLNVNKENVIIAYDEDEKDGSSSDLDPYEFKHKCEQEIAQLKLQKIEGINITVYELLTKSIHFLAGHANNEYILKFLISVEHQKNFPLYKSIIIIRFFQGTRRHDLLEVAKKYSSNIFRGLPCSYVNEILSYLNISELKIFVNTVRTISESDRSKTSESTNFKNKCAVIFKNQPDKKKKIS